MEAWEYRQRNPVADEVSALVAVTGPIIAGVFRSVSADVANAFDKRRPLPLRMLGRLRKEADGDCGITFEYAIHNAIASRDPVIAERVADALHKCGIGRSDPASILFAMEKSGAQELISTDPGLVADSASVLLGEDGRPISLRDSLSAIGAAFRLPDAFLNLAQSIQGLWKTELFLGSSDFEKWVSASVSAGQPRLSAAREPRIAVIPWMPGYSDAIRVDEQKNVVICPVPSDGSFIQVFHEGWQIVQALCAVSFEMPDSADIPNPLHREVARMFVERRDFPIPDVVEAIQKFAQPELLTGRARVVSNVPFETTAAPATTIIITPIPRTSTTPTDPSEAMAATNHSQSAADEGR
jgi:hypothetical protein